MRKQDIALTFFSMAISLFVGIMIGKSCVQFTEPEQQEDTAPPIVADACDPEIIWQCPPEPAAEPEVEVKAPVTPRKIKTLPDAPPPLDPLNRQRLLAWVRDQSDELAACRPAQTGPLRMNVTLELRESGEIRAVNINASSGELPPASARCLRERISRWQPPNDLTEGRRQLVFGLNL